MNILDELVYQHPVGKSDDVIIKLIEIDGHKYIVGSYGACYGGGGCGASISIIHAESCPCKEHSHD